jgi:hypothetical protein
MTGEERLHGIDDLIAHSSLGADGVDQIAARTSEDTLAAILRRKATEEQLDRLDEAFDVESGLAQMEADDRAPWRC